MTTPQLRDVLSELSRGIVAELGGPGRNPFGGQRFDTRAFDELVNAASELFRGQTGGLESISHQAGRLLFETGVVRSVDDGILVFHERLGRDKPSLRRVLAATDRAAGRLPKSSRTSAQKAYTEAVKAGLVVRDKKTGRIVRLNPRGKALVRAVTRAAILKRQERRNRRQKTALAKLQGIGGRKGRGKR